MIRFLTYFCLCFIMTVGCQNGQGNSTPIKALSASEYDYFAKSFKEDSIKEGFSLKTIKEKKYEEKYNDAPANYQMTALGIYRDGASKPSSILIKMEVDRVQSSLMGKGKRKTNVESICLPSGASPEGAYDQYNKSIRSLGYKDFEVYTAFLSEVFAESYLK